MFAFIFVMGDESESNTVKESVNVNYSFETLYDILRQEKNKDDLQKLEPTFYYKVSQFLKTKTGDVAKGNVNNVDSIQALQHKLFNIKRMIREIYERREKKIIFLALNKSKDESNVIDDSTLMPAEKEFFNKLVDLLYGMKSNTLDEVLSNKSIRPRMSNSSTRESKIASITAKNSESAVLNEDNAKIEVKKQIKVKIIASVPKFVGRDMVDYGPFEPEDVVTLPEDVVSLLIKKEKAEELA